MKKIINGKKYDTDTATLLGSVSWGESTSNFNYWRESLYRKKTGEFFLLGEGGARSKYAEPVDCFGTCGYGYGKKIIKLSSGSAKDWAEQYLDVDTYEKAFGEVEE